MFTPDFHDSSKKNICYSVPAIPMQRMDDCWHAALRAILEFHDIYDAEKDDKLFKVEDKDSYDAAKFENYKNYAEAWDLSIMEDTNIIFTPETVYKLLAEKGPFFISATIPQSTHSGYFYNPKVGHAIIITGIKDGIIYYNSPQPSVEVLHQHESSFFLLYGQSYTVDEILQNFDLSIKRSEDFLFFKSKHLNRSINPFIPIIYQDNGLSLMKKEVLKKIKPITNFFTNMVAPSNDINSENNKSNIYYGVITIPLEKNIDFDAKSIKEYIDGFVLTLTQDPRNFIAEKRDNISKKPIHNFYSFNFKESKDILIQFQLDPNAILELGNTKILKRDTISEENIQCLYDISMLNHSDVEEKNFSIHSPKAVLYPSLSDNNECNLM